MSDVPVLELASGRSDEAGNAQFQRCVLKNPSRRGTKSKEGGNTTDAVRPPWWKIFTASNPQKTTNR